MDLSGTSVYNAVRFGPPEQKLAVLQDLKKHVKKDNVHLAWVAKYFEALSIATDSHDAQLQTLAFSLVCHLVKRVSIQNPQGTVLADQSCVVLPLLIPRLADPKTAVKLAAKRAVEAYWLSTPNVVDQSMVDLGLASRNSLLVNECVVWLNHVLTMLNKFYKLDTFLDPLARILREHAADEKLTANIKVLLENYYDMKQNRLRKFDLQKALERNNVPATLRISIMGTENIISRTSEHLHHSKSLPQVSAAKDVPLRHTRAASPPPYTNKLSSVSSLRVAEPVPQDAKASTEMPGLCANSDLKAFLSKVPNYAFDNSLKPLNVSDGNELYQLFNEMGPYFESKETERNWGAREKSIIKMRSLIRGNSATALLEDLLVNIRDVHEGICKSLSSLRTTLSVNSCHLVKEMVFLLGTSFEPLIDLLAPTLIKLCSSTKNLTNTNANMAMCAIWAQCPLNSKLCQKLLHAASERSVNTKAYACSWLQIYIIRSHDSWKSSGSDLVERALLKLLPDPNMQVRQAAKDAYWKYCEYAKEHAVELRSQLDSNINRALERSRPKGLAIPTLPPVTVPKSRPSLKESIMARKRELKNKQSEPRSVSRNDLIHPAGLQNENAPNTSFQRKLERTNSFEDHVASPYPAVTLPKQESKFAFPKSEIESEKQGKSANSSPEASNRKSSLHSDTPMNAFKPHYAQSTFSHPSTGERQTGNQTGSQFGHRRNDSFSDNGPSMKSDAHIHAKVHTEGPKSETETKQVVHESEDPMLKFLASPDEQLLKEGISLLRHAIINGEENSEALTSILRKLSVANPMVLRPLFEFDETLMRKVFKFFSKETFLRLTCILNSPSQSLLDSVISLFTADELYSSLETMLSYLLELTDIVDDSLLIMQLIKFKDKILTMVLLMLTHAASKVPIMNVTLTILTSNLFELLPVVHQTSLVEEYKVLLSKLYAINSTLFISELSSVKQSSKQEIELLVGIDDSLEFKNTDATIFNMTEFTRISPGQNLEHLSPLKFPSDFTMLLPNKRVEAESKAYLEESNFGFVENLMKSKNIVPDERICLEEAPDMKIVPDEDIVMEDVDENHSGLGKSVFEEDMDESKAHESFRDKSPSNCPTDIKLEVGDFNILQKPDANVPILTPIIKDDPHELVEDFASVRLNSQSNSIETFIEKVDPLNKISGRNRPISIYDDSKACSPQKVKDYDFTELNWFNFLMAKMSLDYGLEDLERYSKHDFRSLCEQLAKGSANETSVATMMRYLRVPDPESLTSFLKTEGYTLVEDAVMDYLKHDDSDLLRGLMLIKQLLVSRHTVDIGRLWSMLVDLSGLDSQEPLRTLDLAVGETFDEALCGLFSSKELLQLVTHTLQGNKNLKEGSLKFALECLLKLVSMESLVLSIDKKLVMEIDGAVREFVTHKRADIRKLVIETYGRIYRAARISDADESHEAMQQVMSELTRPQQRIIEYFSQGNFTER